MSEAILKDLKKVAKELGKIPTKYEYYEHGEYTDHAVRKAFGTYGGAVQKAGIADFSDDIEDAFKKQLTPYVGKYEKKHKNFIRVVSSSDHHSLWLDPFCFGVKLDVCRRMQPDVIALVGDVFDFYRVSDFSKDPARHDTMQDEIDHVVENIFAPLRKACPDSQIDFFIGNHEWRLFRYLCDHATGLSSLRALQFATLFQLDKYKINLVARNSLVNMKKEKDAQNFKIYGGCYVLTHGRATGSNTAGKELKKYNMSGSSGHIHQYSSVSTRDLHGPKNWTSMGCMCVIESGGEYIPDLITWNQGFEIAHINTKTKSVLKEYVHCIDGEAMVGGVYYSSK
jgi:hypothetical protein